jgi:ribose 5-phosphate isomerase B
MNIAIGSDHAGFLLKSFLVKELTGIYNVKDFGCFSEESVDYPDFAHLVSKSIINQEVTFGILICGSGNGINMTANKCAKIRSALCWKKEIAELARLHNDANIIALPARFIDNEEALSSVKVFLSTGFEGGRHLRRVEKIDC